MLTDVGGRHHIVTMSNIPDNKHVGGDTAVEKQTKDDQIESAGPEDDKQNPSQRNDVPAATSQQTSSPKKDSPEPPMQATSGPLQDYYGE